MPIFPGPVDYDAVTARAHTIDLGDTPTSMREGFAELLLGQSPEADDRPTLRLGQREARLSGAQTLDGYTGTVVVWLHGGGYVFGSPETHRRVADRFAEACGLPVAALRYRLAPEHPWPAQLDDAVAAVRDLHARGCQVILAGDSAGGHLCVNTALACAKTEHPVKALALFSPNTDRSGLNTTRAANTERDPIVDDAFDTMLARMCFPPAEWPTDHPQNSPVRADLSLLPPTHIEVGGRELLRDDSTVFFAFAKTAGADISLHETPEAFHMWQVWTPWLVEADESLGRVGDWVRGL